MNLTEEEKAILNGEKGETKQKILQTVIKYGEIFGATELAEITHNPHFVLSMGVVFFKDFLNILEKIVDEGNMVTTPPFTVDPYPIDKNVKSNFVQKLVDRIIYKEQKHLEQIYSKMGFKGKDGFSCACYLPEVGNIPKSGDILAWSESSAVVFANSVYAARSHRNAGGIDFFMNMIGKTPKFGLLTDEGRRATWLIEIKTSKKPNTQLLGSAIGMKVIEEVPYIVGLDTFIGDELNSEIMGYLKDFGAACASNGAVGLYHIENLTPEAKEQGKTILKEGYSTYVITDEELERVYRSYPNIWKKPDCKPKKVLIGCPHLSRSQLEWWINEIDTIMGGKKVPIETVLLTAPPLKEEFYNNTEHSEILNRTGVKIAKLCPLMFLANPLTKNIPIVTNSNKLRTYTTARFFSDEKLLEIIQSGEIKEDLI